MIKNYFAFIACTLTLALRDLLFKDLFNHGHSVGIVIFYTGAFSLLTNFVFFKIKNYSVILKNPSFQIIRFIVISISATLAFASFLLLPPTIVNIGSKLTFPLMIILSPIIGKNFNPYEKKMSILMIFALILFLIFSINVNIPISSIAILTLSVIAMIGEFWSLSKTVVEESEVIISLIPSLALIIVGLADSTFFSKTSLHLSINALLKLLLCGILYFIVYYSGKIRYKVLPPGLAEFPSLATALIIWPVDVFFFDSKLNSHSIIAGLIGLLIMGHLIHKRTSLRRITSSQMSHTIKPT